MMELSRICRVIAEAAVRTEYHFRSVFNDEIILVVESLVHEIRVIFVASHIINLR